MPYVESPLSSLPENMDNFPRKQDLTIDDLPLVNLFEQKYSAGDFEGANAILEANPQLKNKINNSEGYNYLRDAIVALEKLFLTDIENYIMNVAKYQGTFDPTKAYKKYDIVDYAHDGAINAYWVKYDNTPVGTLPTNINYFAPQTLRGLQGASGLGLAFRQVWQELTPYSKNDAVSYKGEIYQALTDNTGKNPATSTVEWLKIMYLTPQIVTNEQAPTDLSNGAYWFRIVKRV